MVSIIVPTYDEEDLLPRLLASIGSQSFSDYEVIIADAGSIDKTTQIAEAFGAKVINGGLPGPGRNLGAKASKGELLLFLDADVVLPGTEWLGRKVAQFIKRNLECGTCLVRPLHGKAIDRFSHEVFNAHMVASQLVKAHAPGFCIFAKKELHDQMNGFDESITLAEDHDYVMRASSIGKFRVLYGKGIRVSVRRFERDGRLQTFKKYLQAELYILTKGQITDNRFNYTFGYGKRMKKEDGSSKKDTSWEGI